MGNAGVHSISWENHRCELGYWILGSFEGQGYMAEAVATIEATCFKRGFNRIEIRCSSLNERSASVPKRLGYKLDGVLREEKVEAGRYRDTLVFAKIRSQLRDAIAGSDRKNRLFVSEKQRVLFDAISRAGDLIFAAGPTGISANVCGPFKVTRYGDEDRLEMGDGNFHVHVDWRRVKNANATVVQIEGRQEGVIEFSDGSEKLFRFYRQTGPFADSVNSLVGELLRDP